jgi:hypothetical protein
MKKIVQLFVFTLLCAMNTKAQYPLIWAKNPVDVNLIGGTIQGNSIKADLSGNTYVTGKFSATADFDPGSSAFDLTSKGGDDIFLAKYKANGTLDWAFNIGGTGNDVGNSLVLDPDGNSYLTGFFNSEVDFNPGETENILSAGSNMAVFMAKFSPDGSLVWAKKIGGDNPAHWAEAKAITIDASGKIYITGNFFGTIDFDPGEATANRISNNSGSHIFLAKYSSTAGELEYAINMGNTVTNCGMAVAADGSGNAFITGYFGNAVDFDPGVGTASLTGYGTDVFVAKYGPTGTYEQAIRIGQASASSENDHGRAISLDAIGNIYVGGYFRGTVQFGTSSLTSTGMEDIFLAKYNSAFVETYALRIGGTSQEFLNGMVLNLDTVFITGSFRSTADFDPGTGTANLVSSGSEDIFIAKYGKDAGGNDGQYLGAIKAGASGSDVGNGIAISPNNQVVTTGYFHRTVDFDPGAGTANLSAPITPSAIPNAFLAKYNASLGYFNAGSMGGYPVSSNNQEALSLKVDENRNIYVTGYFQGKVDFSNGNGDKVLESSGSEDIYLAKYDENGNCLWAKKMGGTSSERGLSLAIDNDGNVYLTGYFQGTASFNPGEADPINLIAQGGLEIFMAKFSNTGDLVFAKKIGGNDNDRAESILVKGNTIYLTGYFSGTVDFNPGDGTNELISNGSGDIFLAKYNTSGEYVYALAFGGTSHDEGTSVSADDHGNAYITGKFSETVDFDPGIENYPLSSSGLSDVFFASYNPSGSLNYAKRIGSGSDDQGIEIVADENKNVFLTGTFAGSPDFDPGPETAVLSTDGGTDIFIARYDAGGNYLYANRIGGNSNEFVYDATIDSDKNIYITGIFSGTVDFNCGSELVNLTSNGSSDFFIAKYDSLGNYISARNFGNSGSSEKSSSIAVDSDRFIYISGVFNNIVDFDSGTGVLELFARNANDAFLAKYKQLPEIEVYGNSRLTTSGDITPSDEDHTDFGDVYLTENLIRTFTIKNSGQFIMNLTGSPTKIELNGNGFSLEEDASENVIEIGKSLTFKIKFTPDEEKEFSGQVSISSDDVNTNPFTFTIKGNGLKIPQSITNFSVPSPKTYGDAPFIISATGGSSGNPVVFSSENENIASCSGTNGSTITILKAGTVKIFANQAGNTIYTDAQAEQTLIIQSKTITLNGLDADDKTYDGNTSANLSGSAVLNGLIPGDEVIPDLEAATAEFENKHVGVDKIVNVSGIVLAGKDASNYLMQSPVLKADVIAKVLYISGLTANNKEYDGNTTANLTGTPQLSGVIGAEDVSLHAHNPLAAFENKMVGTNKKVLLSGYSLIGTEIGNYSLDATLLANISTRGLTLTGLTANNKTYDGTTNATFSGGTLTTVVSPDVVQIESITGSFTNPNAGNSKPVDIQSIVLSGADKNNYHPIIPTGLTANILKATPIITWAYPADIVAGTPLSTTQLNATVNIPGNITYTPPAGTVLNVGNQQDLNADFTPSDAINYTNATRTVRINVLPATNVEFVAGNHVKVYPNPAVDLLKIEGLAFIAGSKSIELSVIDLSGKKVYSKLIKNPGVVEHLPIQFLLPGVYFVTFDIEKERIVRRFVKSGN